MSYQKVSKQIVKNSIKNVICIDDQFSEPYSPEEEEIGLDKKMYECFRDRDCNVNMVKYPSKVSISRRIQNNDLVILDWELSTVKPKYVPTLELLKKMIETNISFVCIYTHSSDISKISNILSFYFSGYNSQEIGSFYNGVYDTLYVEGYEKFLDNEQIKECFIKYLHSDKSQHKKIRGEVRGYFIKYLEGVIESDEKPYQIIKDLHASLNNVECHQLFMKLGLYFSNALIPPVKTKVIKTLCKEKHIYWLDGKVIIIRNKVEIDEGFAVTADALYDEISENIINAPSSILTLLWLELKNHLTDTQKLNGNFLKEIDENAFLNNIISSHFNSEGEIEKDKLHSFITDILSDELKYNLVQLDSEAIKLIEGHLTEEKKEEIESIKSNPAFGESTCNLNHLITFNNSKILPKKIRFGDVFIGSNQKYYLCITAHCDCLDPRKIDNNFIFAETDGKYTSISNIKTLDSEYVSFVKKEDKNIEIVRWVDSQGKIKVKSLYILATDLTGISKIQTSSTSEKLELKFIGNQKENFTQRIANYAYSWMNRVGVSYSAYKKS